MKYALIIFWLFATTMLYCDETAQIHARYTAVAPVIDGSTDDGVWQNAEWVELDLSRPAHPQSMAEWQEIYRAAGTIGYVEEQFNEKVRAALLWTKEGLYLAMTAEDVDIIGRMKDGEPLWLEDVLEIFIARRATAGEPTMEIQVNPANAVLVLPPAGQTFPRPPSGVAIEGSLNNHLERDRQWSMELFLSWDDLTAANLAEKPGPDGGEAAAIRFAAWDLSIYSQLRLNRFTSPGQANPHFPEFYRRVICDAPTQ